MMRTPCAPLLGALVAAALAPRSDAGEGREIAYRFEEGARYAYRIRVPDLEVTTVATRDGAEQSSTTTTDMSVAVDLAVERPSTERRPGGVLTASFRDLSVTQGLSDASGEVELIVEGTDVVVKRYGRTIVDTKKNKGTDRARGILAEFAFLGEEATLTIGPRGELAKVKGPPSMRAFLGQDGGSGLWALVTPVGRVREGESWESESRITRLEGLDLSANPLTFAVTYTFEEMVEEDGAKLARIAVNSRLDRSDLSAKATSVGRRPVPLRVSELGRTVEGTFHFDLEKGRIARSEVKVDLTVRTEMTVGSGDDEETLVTEVTGSGTVTVTPTEPAPEPEPEADEEAAGPAEETVGEPAPSASEESPE